MQYKKLEVLLIEDSPEFAELVLDWLTGPEANGAFAVNWKESLQAGLDSLSQTPVDVIVLDLSLPDSKGKDTFLKIDRAAPGTPVIVLSAAKSEAIALAMIADGAADYLVKSACNADNLGRSIRYALLRPRAKEQKVENNDFGKLVETKDFAKFIGVIGPKGGVGTTTFAWNLAVDLARQTGEKVLVCDFDADSGLISFLAGTNAQYTLHDAVAAADRLSEDSFERFVIKGPNGVHVLSSPGWHGAAQLETEATKILVKEVRRFYKWIVADFARPSPSSLALAQLADDVLLVSSTTMDSLYETKRFIDSIKPQNRGRLSLVLNQATRGRGASWATTFGLPVSAVLPFDSELQDAFMEQRLINENSAFRKEISNLARKLAGLSEIKSKGVVSSLFKFTRDNVSLLPGG